MAFLTKNKLFSRKWFIDYTLISVGAFILAAGFVYFIVPHKIVPGGVYGIAIIVHHLNERPIFFLARWLSNWTVRIAPEYSAHNCWN